MFIIGLALTIVFLPLALKNLYLMSEHPYAYFLVDGLTEESFTAMTILFVILAMTGIVLAIFGWVKRRNKAALDSLLNSEKQNYCEHCKINVSEQYTNCPVCGNLLKNKGD